MSDLVITSNPAKETATTVTLEWTPPPAAAGYVFVMKDGKRSSTLDPTRNFLKVAKSNLPVTISALRTLAQGVYPPPVQPTPVNVPAPPVLNNPVVFTCKSGVPNVFDAQGRDAIVKSSGVIEQGPKGDNPIVALKNSPNAIVESLSVHAGTRQSAGVGTAYGYGLYLIGCGTVYVTDYTATGPGLAQALVGFNTKKIVVVRPKWSVMHPVWHVAKGAPTEVHTDAFQSYGGPGVLEMYDADVETCGSLIQTQPFQYGPYAMGQWKLHRCDFRQVVNPDSDEMPYALTKDWGGSFPRWPTDFVDCKLHALGIPFGVGWVRDEAAWQPGGTWNNTGQPWVMA